MARTTILLDDVLLLEMKSIAQRKGTTVTAVIKEAVSEYVQKQPPRGLPSFTGKYASKGKGAGRIAENIEKILREKARKREGW